MARSCDNLLINYIHHSFYFAQIVIQVNQKEIEDLKGYIHEHDSVQYVFMHKSSGPKFDIPFNNTLYGGMPNHYHFKLTSKSVDEFLDTNCLLETKQNDSPDNGDCYVKHLENILDCQLPWDGSLSNSKSK